MPGGGFWKWDIGAHRERELCLEVTDERDRDQIEGRVQGTNQHAPT